MDIKRILLSINVRWWNAEAAYALNIAKAFTRHGVRVWIILNKNSPVHEKASAAGIPVLTDILLDSSSPFVHRQNLKKILRFVDENDIQLINSFKSAGSFLFSMVRKRRPHITYIKTRGEARPPKNHFLNRYAYGIKSCDGVITVGDIVKNWVEALNPDGVKIRTIYYCSDPVQPPETPMEQVREDLTVPKAAKTMALIGRIHDIKGHLVLLKALSLLRSSNYFVLFLVKDLNEFPEELAKVKTYIHENGMEQNVKILGFINNLGDIMQCIDLGVIPSLESEVNCRVAVEFFSAGIPVLAFPTGTLPEVIAHLQSGYICPEKDEQALAAGVKELFADRESLEKMGKNALLEYQKRFSIDQLYNTTNRFYLDCKIKTV